MPTDDELREVARSRVTEARRALDRVIWALSVPEPDWVEVAGEIHKVNDLMCRLWSDCMRDVYHRVRDIRAEADKVNDLMCRLWSDCMRDVYHRVRDIRAEAAAEDRERGRRTW